MTVKSFVLQKTFKNPSILANLMQFSYNYPTNLKRIIDIFQILYFLKSKPEDYKNSHAIYISALGLFL